MFKRFRRSRPGEDAQPSQQPRQEPEQGSSEQPTTRSIPVAELGK